MTSEGSAPDALHRSLASPTAGPSRARAVPAVDRISSRDTQKSHNCYNQGPGDLRPLGAGRWRLESGVSRTRWTVGRASHLECLGPIAVDSRVWFATAMARKIIDALADLTITAVSGTSVTELVVPVLVGAALFFLTWRVKESQATDALNKIELGERCLRCEGQQTHILNGTVECGACGYVTTLAKLRASQVSNDEIRMLSRPDIGDD